MWRKQNPHALLVGMHTGAATVENSMAFPQKKLKINLPFDLASPPLEIYTTKPKTLTSFNRFSAFWLRSSVVPCLLFIKLRQVSKKLGKFLGKWSGEIDR